MHKLQPKCTLLKKEDIDNLLNKFNISLAQLPRILKKDPQISEDVTEGDVLKFERKNDGEVEEYFRLVI